MVPSEDKTSRPYKGDLPLSAKHTFYVKEGMTKETQKTDFLNCIEGQKRVISFSRVNAVDNGEKPYRGYNSTVWGPFSVQKIKDMKRRNIKFLNIHILTAIENRI
jgi:hypothetical protein